MVLGKLSPEMIRMESIYSDRYANLMEGQAMEAYFVQLVDVTGFVYPVLLSA